MLKLLHVARSVEFLVSIVALSALAACGDARNLYVAHDTVVGVNAQVNPNRQQGRLVIGYDRDFATVIPTKQTTDGERREAMSLLGCTRLQVDGIFLTSYSDELASGVAAKAFAEKLASKDGKPSAFFTCHQADQKQKKTGDE